MYSNEKKIPNHEKYSLKNRKTIKFLSVLQFHFY